MSEHARPRVGSDEPGLPRRVGEQLAKQDLGPAAPTSVDASPADASDVPELHEVDVPDELREQIESAMSKYPELRSASLPALWAVQRRYGWCSPEGIRQAAAVMGVNPAYLEGLASFYDLFATTLVGRHRVLVCHNISCWLNGGDELLRAFCEAAGVDYEEADHGGASSADGEFHVKGFECLGACDLAPMASLDEVYFGPLEPGDAATALDQLRSGDDVLPDKALRKRPLAGGELAEVPGVGRASGEAAENQDQGVPRGGTGPAAPGRSPHSRAHRSPSAHWEEAAE